MLKSWNPKRPSTNRNLADKWLGDNGDLAAYSDVERPKTRADCVDGPRPCPFVGCRFSLYLDVDPKNGVIKFNFPDRAPWEMPPDSSCALDVVSAHPGGADLPAVSAAINLAYDRTFAVVSEALKSAREPAAEIVDQPWAVLPREKG